MYTHTFIGKTFQGLEPFLAEELGQIGAQDIEILRRGVKFTGTQETMYKANLYTRTALRYLKVLGSFEADNPNKLYKGVRSIDWTKVFKPSDFFAVHSVVHSRFFAHSGFVALKSKDAIVDQFRELSGTRPSVDNKRPDINIHIHIAESTCTVSIDSSGNPLNQRGYRSGGHEAPLNEVLAAGMIKLSGWDAKSNFVDPMCGSGTLVIEAAMMALNIPPQLQRTQFDFMNWLEYDEALWKKLQKEATHKSKLRPSFPYKIIGADISPKYTSIAARDCMSADVAGLVEIQKSPLSKFSPPEGSGVLITNPPYGERMDVEKIEQLYAQLGTKFKQEFTGWEAWVLSANEEGIKQIGLKTSEKHILLNGSIECKYLKYQIYEGSKKHKGNTDAEAKLDSLEMDANPENQE